MELFDNALAESNVYGFGLCDVGVNLKMWARFCVEERRESLV